MEAKIPNQSKCLLRTHRCRSRGTLNVRSQVKSGGISA
jgi:hypothetical protein